jgi:HK97 family phage portal protein
MTGRETGNAHLLTWGNSYAQIVWNKPQTRILRLQPLGPDLVTPKVSAAGELEYHVRERNSGAEPTVLARDEVLHVPGLSFDALVGLSTVRVAKAAVRAGMSQDNQADRFVTRGIRPPGVIRFPAGRKFKDANDATQYRDRFRVIHAKAEGDQEVMILEDGAEWQDIGIDPDKAQLLESRSFSRGEICGLFQVPPFMVGDVEKSTSWGTGIEELTIGFVVYCLLKYIRRIEQEYNRKLFRGAPGVFCEHVLGGLLKGDSLKRAQSLEILCRNGIITVNEWRKLEGFNPLPGGNVRYFSLAYGRIDDGGNDIAPPAGAVAPPARPAAAAVPPAVPPAVHSTLRRVFAAAVQRCVGKEANHARRAAKTPAEFVPKVDEFYAAYAAEVAENVGPALDACAAAGLDPGCDYPAVHADRSKAELLDAAGSTGPAGLADAVERVLAGWESERAAQAAAELQPTGEPCATTES